MTTPMRPKILIRPLIINLPEEVMERIKKEIAGTSFQSVEDFVQKLVLQKFPPSQENVYSEEEEEVIRERLRRLGYLE
jgi:hypothetical protein